MLDLRQRRSRGSLSGAVHGRVGRCALLVAIFFVHALGRSDAYGWVEGCLAGLTAVLLAAAVMRALGDGVPRLPILEWVCLQYYAIWVFPILLPGNAGATPLGELRESAGVAGAMTAVLAFATCVLLGFHAARAGVGPRPARSPLRSASRPLLIGLVLVSVVVTSTSDLIAESHRFSFAVKLLLSPILVLILLSFELRRTPDWRLGQLALAFCATAAVCIGLGAASLERALLPVLLLFFLALGARGSIRLPHIALAAALVIFMMPLSGEYRVLAGIGEAAYKPYAGVRGELAARIGSPNALRITADTLRAVPARVPYGRGETWAPLLVNWIPRPLWPGKPSLGRLAADSLGTKLDYAHPIRVPAVVDGYYNFGWLGIALAGLAAGLYYGVLARVYDPQSRFRYALALFAMAMTRPTGPVPMPFGGVLQTCVAVGVVVGLMELAARGRWLGAWIRGSRDRAVVAA